MSVIRAGWRWIGRVWYAVALILPILLLLFLLLVTLLASPFGAGAALGRILLLAIIAAFVLLLGSSFLVVSIFVSDILFNFFGNLVKGGLKPALSGVVTDASNAWSRFKAGVRDITGWVKAGLGF